ncbi:MAG: GNAT family N-acetyltransferase [Gulosibacter sp.]|uniref:GNAT family N-acetyltransferase n=1 Tax=Gulosibacter sp. TaxID=2817531 RepID=UPI003F920B89
MDSDNPKWQLFLSGIRHDIWHTAEYHAAQDKFLGTETQLLVVTEGDQRLLIPLILKPLDEGFFDATSPSDLASPVWSENASMEWRHEAIRALLADLRDRNVVSLFLRSHPLFVSHFEAFSDVAGIVRHTPIYWIPLNKPLEEIRAGMRKNHQRNIRKARTEGHHSDIDENWRYLDAFYRIYSETMERLGAHPDYRYSAEYFYNLRDTVKENCSLWILKMNDELAGAHFVTEIDGTVEYLYGATDAQYYHKVPQVLIFDDVLEWAHTRGDSNYVLGGGMQESLRHFKAGFTTTNSEFATCRVVVNPIEYGRLCAKWEVEHDERVGGLSDFFPAYRKDENRLPAIPDCENT